MAKAIRMTRTGGPEVLEYVDVEVGEPGPGEARVRQHAIGLNFIDVYFRTGLYPMPLPSGLGQEGAGVVEAVGEGVTHVQPGDRVAYAGRPNGAYSALRTMPADILVRLPDAIDFETAAAMMLQGLTVQYLFNGTYQIKPGQTILFHAAAGGVGLIACQWARAMGVNLIGTVGSKEKAALAQAAGAAHVINYNEEDIVARVLEITDGAKVPVVYDSVGKDTFIRSLDCLQPRGLMVSFGNASGPVPPFSMNELASRNSLYLTRPSLGAYVATRDALEERAADLFAMVESGKVKIDIHQRFALAEAAKAHIALEARRTTGSTILLP
ncbi:MULTISPECIES: quinone oxidoreductase [unclassified Massilia]|uniref:quinone oxidoreductase family protein n=1 Tax=unclassified Massilia TaxID=2609279 RepID=UPI00177F3BC6|nr:MULTISPECIES: quinone oxidoreductase [unclassified Massilia]MBD8529857.1 quinone oxidoreductase [Massilia sp. CFBP 13647]MBD8672131.1 quinone oxidoreductase [Massilia sp. CFBP 13721]